MRSLQLNLSSIGICSSSHHFVKGLVLAENGDLLNIVYNDDAEKLMQAITMLYKAGCTIIFIDGSSLTQDGLSNWKTCFFSLKDIDVAFFNSNDPTKHFINSIIMNNKTLSFSLRLIEQQVGPTELLVEHIFASTSPECL